jgi:hypothetical protein
MKSHMEAIFNPALEDYAAASEGNAAATWLERLLSFPLVVAAVFAALVYRMVPASMADPDIWWHLRNAETMFRLHSFIVKDAYSFTAMGAPWIDHEWLAEVPFYLGWRAMGERGVLLATALAIEAVMLGVFYLAYRRSGSIKAAVLVSTIAALLATVSFGPRTLLFGWICLVAELIVLERFRWDERAVWALPALFAFWVNTHGSWMIGMVLLGAFVVCGCVRVDAGSIENPRWTAAQLRKLVTAACLSVGALFVNPYGWRLVAYPFNLAFHQKLNIANVEEWQALDFHAMRGRLFLICLAAMFLLQLVRRRRWSLDEVAFLLVGVYSALTYSRFLFLAAILVMPLLAKEIPGLGRSRTRRNRPWFNAALLLALAPLAAFHFPAPAAPHRAAESRQPSPEDAKYPLRALASLNAFHPQGNVFNEYIWGGFLIYHARQVPVMIDSRADIFEYNGTFKDYLDAVHLKNTDAILNKYKIRYVLFERDSPLVTFLVQTPAWKIDYEDETAVLLERSRTLDDAL